MAADAGPADFTELLMVSGVGPRTVQALAMVAEVVHVAPIASPIRRASRLLMAARTRQPFLVPLQVYDETIRVLKSAVQKVAAKNNVHADLLGNYLAYRLSLEGQNWWGTATRLQSIHADPWQEVRDFVIGNLNWDVLSAPDRDLLSQALETQELEYAG